MSKKDLKPAVSFFPEQDTKLDNEQLNNQDIANVNEQVNDNGSNQVIEQGNTKDDNIDTNKDIEQSTIQNTDQDTKKVNEQDGKQSPTQYTIKIPSKNEPFDKRLVANVTKSQKDYVIKMGKKFANESDFVRHMIDHFMKTIKIE